MRLGSESGLTPRPRSGRRWPAGRRAEARVPTRPFRGPSGPRGAGTEHGGPLASPPSPPLRAEAASQRSVQAAGACAASVRLFPVGNGGRGGEAPGRDAGRGGGEDDSLARVSEEGERLALVHRDLGLEWRSRDPGSFAPCAAPTSFVSLPRSWSRGGRLGDPRPWGKAGGLVRRFQHRSPFASTVVRGAGRRGPRVDCTVNPWAKGLGRRVPAGKPGRGDRPSRWPKQRRPLPRPKAAPPTQYAKEARPLCSGNSSVSGKSQSLLLFSLSLKHG